MSNNELTTTEHGIIYALTGRNLNAMSTVSFAAEAPASYGARWQYRSAAELNRPSEDIWVESELRDALLRLNPTIAAQPDHADTVLHYLRKIVHAAPGGGLVRANEAFRSWLLGEQSMPFGPNGRHVAVRLLDSDDPAQNTYVVTNQYRVRQRGITKIPDLMLLVNGLPLVAGEVKTPVRPAVSWVDALSDLQTYENEVPELFVPNVLSFATEGKELYYGAVRTPAQYWSPWRLEADPDKTAPSVGLDKVHRELAHLVHPVRLFDLLRHFTIYKTDKRKRRSKLICRFQQYEGANRIVERVRKGIERQGLIWHFQGSGKSLLMLFAAQKLRKVPELNSPTVLILVDRTDLDTQISGIFSAADVANVETTDSIEELQRLLARGTRKIIISTIHKFRDAPPEMNTADNVIVLVDEAHRTQEGDLGRQMRAALPNAFLFGLTGTPVNRSDKNTFWAFGSERDGGGYLSRYTFHDSIRDGATLPLHFEPRLVDVHLDKDAIDEAFAQLASTHQLSDEDADALNQRSVKMAAFLKAPKRVEKIVADIAEHYREKVAPHGFKAMIVTPDRYACVQYKEELDKYFPPAASTVVISTSAKDDSTFRQQWGMDKGQQERTVELFNDADSELKFLIVTAKLLTGFDAPILQVMYLDKSLRDHTLLQAICRTNRLYPNKHFGRVVDYFGVFDDAAKALQFDEQSVQRVITNLEELREKFPEVLRETLAHFPGVDRTVTGFAGLEAAQQAIRTDEARDRFAADYKHLSKLWEALSPDRLLDPYQQDYRWLTQVYESVRPASDSVGRLLWMSLGAQTTQLMQQHIKVGQVHRLSEFVLDADTIENIFNHPNAKEAKRLERELIARFKRQQGNPTFKKLSERLEALRDRAEQGLITSIEFVKELCQIARDTIQAEKQTDPATKTPQAALTELFLELRTEETPAVVERIVRDIDEVVRVVRFPSWQSTSKGEREVRSSLRRILWTKYKIKDQVLFERAYEYIKEYY